MSPTSVTTSFECVRRAVLKETLSVSQPTNPKAFLGTLKHELFERGLLSGVFSVECFREEALKIVQARWVFV